MVRLTNIPRFCGSKGLVERMCCRFSFEGRDFKINLIRVYRETKETVYCELGRYKGKNKGKLKRAN